MADQFGQLAVSLADGADQPLTQQRLVEFAVRGIPGAEHASMTVVDGHRPPRTTARSDELPYQWDQLQYEHGEGPCLEAIATNGVESGPDLRTENRWPRFARAIVDQTAGAQHAQFPAVPHRAEPGRAEPVRHPTRPRSPTNPPRPGRCSPRTRRWRCSPRPDMTQANHLTRALETNREIGVAMGILMANGKLTSQQAFDQLRTASQNLNRKLHDIAADVALTGALPPVPLKLFKR